MLIRRRSRSAFTLLEVLLATAVTLLMMLSLAKIFTLIGDGMKQGRAGLTLNNRLRAITFRLRNDLNNLTVRLKPPADAVGSAGYLEYTDGPMSDFTCMLFDPNNAPDSKVLSNVIRSSRIGDMDDVLMYTARAGDSWFTGKVPAFLLRPVMMDPSNPQSDTDGNSVADGLEDKNSNGTIDGLDPVVISSQHAEIAVFARPTGDSDGDGMPDGFQLYYRTLLIRPDLNMSDANGIHLPFLAPTSSVGPYMVGGPLSSLPSPTCDMALAHQQCDLSIRRVFNTADGLSSTNDLVAANSLEDLMNPANRFAHVQAPLPNSPSTTMPVLALTDALPILLTTTSSVPAPMYTERPAAGNGLLIGTGFIHPAFTLGGISSSTVVSNFERLGEDVLATDCVGFDAKVFDSAVALLAMTGPDGMAGAGGVGGAASDGSDDIVVTPNDPGYGPAMAALGAGSAATVGNGAYVDLMWGRKVMGTLPYYGMTATNMPLTAPIFTEYSGFAFTSSNWNSVGKPFFDPSVGLILSGKALRNASMLEPPMLLQATLDSWTTRYESDGILQAQRTSNSSGVVQIDAVRQLYNASVGGTDTVNLSPSDSWRLGNTDAGTDGVDNNGASTGNFGIDDLSETETLPPFPLSPRGLKISIRLEDRGTRQVRQMSVANDTTTP
ncbi:MAG: hypothetical protein U0892_13110 [Pirellulales bacterium]